MSQCDLRTSSVTSYSYTDNESLFLHHINTVYTGTLIMNNHLLQPASVFGATSDRKQAI